MRGRTKKETEVPVEMSHELLAYKYILNTLGVQGLSDNQIRVLYEAAILAKEKSGNAILADIIRIQIKDKSKLET